MKRREFIVLLGAAAASSSGAAVAQQTKSMRRVGVLTGGSGLASDARVATFVQALALTGWNQGQNLRLDIRHGRGDLDGIRKQAAELVALEPDVIVTVGGTATGRLLQTTKKVPIVFT